jgi:hypothetical protein
VEFAVVVSDVVVVLVLDELVVLVLVVSEDVLVLVLVFDEELVLVVDDDVELCLCVVVDVECVEVEVPWLLESVVVEVMMLVVDVEFDENEVVTFAFPFVLAVLPPSPAVDKFLRLAEVTTAAINTTSIPMSSTVADLFNLP